MEGLKPEVVSLLQFLLPGLIAACVYYLLTAFRRPEALERIIQALIFTGVVQAFVIWERWIAEAIALHWFSFGPWLNDVAAVITAILVGVVVAKSTTNDAIFSFLRWLHLTKQMGYPTEWFGALYEHRSFLVLQLKDERRLYGFPQEWPSSAEKGHFRIAFPRWLAQKKDDGSMTDETDLSTSISSVLISVDEIRWIEFLPPVSLDDEKRTDATPATPESAARNGPSWGERESVARESSAAASTSATATATEKIAG